MVATREPYGELRELLVSGAAARWTPKAEVLLHSAARAEHLARVILPALEEGADVLCDRFSDSTLAYQGAQGAGTEFIRAVTALTLGACAPDLIIVLDMAAAAAQKRLEQRGTVVSRYEKMPLTLHEKVRAAYLAAARARPKFYAVIDAAQDEQAVAALVQAAVEGVFADER